MGLVFVGEVLCVREDSVASDITSFSEESTSTEETVIIEDEMSPLSYESDHCVSHSAMILLTLIFGIYSIIRYYIRKSNSQNFETNDYKNVSSNKSQGVRK